MTADIFVFIRSAIQQYIFMYSWEKKERWGIDALSDAHIAKAQPCIINAQISTVAF